MGLWKSLRRMLGQEPARPAAPPRPLPPEEDDESEPAVPEIAVPDLMQALAAPNPPLVLDVREPYEWQQVRMPFARHIPMNEVPQHVDELRADLAGHAGANPALVVVCAHGSRSYSVAAWLIDQGLDAGSLAGGITQWSIQGGEVRQGA